MLFVVVSFFFATYTPVSFEGQLNERHCFAGGVEKYQ